MTTKAYEPPEFRDKPDHQISRHEQLTAVFPKQALSGIVKIRFEVKEASDLYSVSITVPYNEDKPTEAVFPPHSFGIIKTNEVKLIAHPTNSENGYGTVEQPNSYHFSDK